MTNLISIMMRDFKKVEREKAKAEKERLLIANGINRREYVNRAAYRKALSKHRKAIKTETTK